MREFSEGANCVKRCNYFTLNWWKVQNITAATGSDIGMICWTFSIISFFEELLLSLYIRLMSLIFWAGKFPCISLENPLSLPPPSTPSPPLFTTRFPQSPHLLLFYRFLLLPILFFLLFLPLLFLYLLFVPFPSNNPNPNPPLPALPLLSSTSSSPAPSCSSLASVSETSPLLLHIRCLLDVPALSLLPQMTSCRHVKLDQFPLVNAH